MKENIMANAMNLLAVNSEQLIQWIALGVCGVILLIAFIAGFVKGFSNFGRRPVSWAFGCAAFLLLETFFHENNFVFQLLGLNFDPVLYSFLSTMLWLVVALLLRGIVFGLLGLMIQCSKNKKLKKVAQTEQEEKIGGEEFLPDENKPYTPLPVNGKIKPGPLNRLFGGVFAVLNMAVVLALILSVAMVILSITPLANSLSWLYTGAMETVWNYVHTYALDFVLIALMVLIVAQGYKVGALYGVRSIGVFLMYVAAVVGAFYLPFSPLTQEGAIFHFLTIAGEKVTAILPTVIPATIWMIAFKVVVGIVLAIVLCLLVKLIAWLLDKLLDLVDNVGVLTVIDGVIGAIVFIVIAAVAFALIVSVLYVLNYYGIFAASELFTPKSPLLYGSFELCDEFLRPLLETIALKLA